MAGGTTKYFVMLLCFKKQTGIVHVLKPSKMWFLKAFMD